MTEYIVCESTGLTYGCYPNQVEAMVKANELCDEYMKDTENTSKQETSDIVACILTIYCENNMNGIILNSSCQSINRQWVVTALL